MRRLLLLARRHVLTAGTERTGELEPRLGLVEDQPSLAEASHCVLPRSDSAIAPCQSGPGRVGTSTERRRADT